MYDWHLFLGIAAGLIPILALVPYIKDIKHGTTRPNAVSYFLWVLLLIISLLAQWTAGASWSIIFLVGDLLGTSVVLALCLIGYGYGKYGKIEWICTVLAIIAIVSWQVTNQPLLAIIFTIVADLMASIPTVIKTYRDPQSEIPGPWLMIAFAGMLSLLSTTIYDLPNLLFPSYILFINGATGIIALRGRYVNRYN